MYFNALIVPIAAFVSERFQLILFTRIFYCVFMYIKSSNHIDKRGGLRLFNHVVGLQQNQMSCLKINVLLFRYFRPFGKLGTLCYYVEQTLELKLCNLKNK